MAELEDFSMKVNCDFEEQWPVYIYVYTHMCSAMSKYIICKKKKLHNFGFFKREVWLQSSIKKSDLP